MKLMKNMMILFGFMFLFFVATMVSVPAQICAGGFSYGDGKAILTKIMPYATAVVSGLVLIVVTIMPTAKKLLEISRKLAGSNKNLQDTLSENEQLKAELKSVHTELSNIRKTNEKLKKMIELGFCNVRELVEGGFAREIVQVSKDDEE